MASLLLDSIINETVQGFNSRGDMLDRLILSKPAIDTTAATTNSGDLTANQHDPASLDQLDQMVSMMQEVDMGQRERIFWTLLFSLMVLVAAGGNIIVIYIVSTNREMKSVTNYFLVNLSLADTMVSTVNVIFNFISMLISDWPFGSIYCKISNFIAILSISASVFTLTAISCDRYNAILHPLRPRMSHKHAIGWILLIWTLSSALAMPNIIYSGVVEDRLINGNLARTCSMIWPDGTYPESSFDHIYNIVILVVTYLVPILTMAVLYYKVGKELWGYEAIGENIEKQARALMAKKKIVKMMIVVVIIFALCWLPYHAFFVVNYYLPTIFQDGPLLYKRCYLIMYWLAMSNSMYNPIIIYFMNSKFCHEFKRVLCLICCCKIYVPPMKNDCLSQNNHQSAHYPPSARNSPNTATASALATASKRLGNIVSVQHELTTKLTSGSQLSSQLAMPTTTSNRYNAGQDALEQALTTDRAELQNQLGPIEVIVTQSAEDDFSHLATAKAGAQSCTTISNNYDYDDDTIIACKHANAIDRDEEVQLDRSRPNGQNGLISKGSRNNGASSSSSNSRRRSATDDTGDDREQKPFLRHTAHGNQSIAANYRPSDTSRRPSNPPDNGHDTAKEVCYKF